MKSSSGSSVRRVGLMLAVASISCSTAAPVSKFTSLDSCGAIDISVQAGSDYDVTIEGSPEYVKYAGATVKDGTLYIQNEAFSPAKGSMSVVAVVTVPKDALTSITSFGSGDIAASGLSASTFSVTSQGSGDVTIDAAVSGALDVSSNGSGDVTVGGSSQTASLSSNGSGDVSVFGVAGNADISSNGSGDVYVGASAASTISGSSFGSGDISYGGGGTCSVKGCEADTESFTPPPPLASKTVTGISQYGSGTCGGIPFTPASASPSTTPSTTPSATPSASPSTSPSTPTMPTMPSTPTVTPASAAVQAKTVLAAAAAAIAAAIL